MPAIFSIVYFHTRFFLGNVAGTATVALKIHHRFQQLLRFSGLTPPSFVVHLWAAFGRV